MTKGRNIKNSVKSEPLFDVHWRYLDKFLIDLQAKVSRFRCRISLFCLFSQNLAQ